MNLKKLIFLKSFFIIVFFFVALTAGGISAADNNILINPGFEANQPGQQPTFPPWWEWSDTGEGMTGSTGGEVTDEVSHSGRRSAVRYVKGKALGCYAQTIEVVPGEIVEGGIWIKTSEDFSGAEAYLRIEFKTKDGSIIQAVDSKRIVSPNETWKLYTLGPSAAPDRTAIAVFGIFLLGKDKNSRGKAWFDDGYMRLKVKGLV